MGNLTRWVPRPVTGTAVVHLAYGLSAPSMARTLGEVARGGVAGAVRGDPERAPWLWYTLTGVATLGLGEVARWGVRETGRVPARPGGWLLAVAVPLTVAMPGKTGPLRRRPALELRPADALALGYRLRHLDEIEQLLDAPAFGVLAQLLPQLLVQPPAVLLVAEGARVAPLARDSMMSGIRSRTSLSWRITRTGS